MLRSITRSSVPSSASPLRTSISIISPRLQAYRPFSTSMSVLDHTSGTSSKQPYDTIIIGGGWAGLTAALRLSESAIPSSTSTSNSRQPSILLLESRTRLGGRAFTHTYDRASLGSSQRRVEASAGDIAASSNGGEVESVDFGCSWLHGYNEGNPVRQLCDELGIPVKLASELQGKRKGAVLIGSGGEVVNEELASKIRNNLDSAMSAAMALARDSPESIDDSTSLASFLLDESKSPLYTNLSTPNEKALAASYARLLHVPHGIPLESVSLRWLGYGEAVAGTDAAPEGGFSRVIEGMVRRMEGKIEIRTGMEVERVEERGEEGLVRVRVSTKSTDGGEPEVSFEGKTTICTLPLAILQARSQANSSSVDSLFSPPLSKRKQAAIARTSVGDLNKVLLVYDTPQPWWRDAEGTGTFVVLPSSESSSSSATSDLDKLLRSTLLLVSPSISPRTNTCSLLVMIGATSGGARGLEKFKRQDVAEALHARLAKVIVAAEGEGEVKGPVHNFMSRWSGHEFTQGATSSPVGVGGSPLDFVTLSQPEWPSKRLLFAGEHTDVDTRGSITGAVRSGEREARRVGELLRMWEGKEEEESKGKL